MGLSSWIPLWRGRGNTQPLAQLTFTDLIHYHDSSIKLATNPSLATIPAIDTSTAPPLLALAYAASTTGTIAHPSQHLRFTLSKDGGETWTPSRVIMFGLTPLWNPVLHYDTHRSRLFLFYCESRKTNSPGGDIKFITSKDLGITWTPPSTILSHEGIEEVPKVCSNSLVESSLDGTWYLPIHSEPRQSNEIFNTNTFSALNTVPDAAYTNTNNMIPPTAKKQSPVTWASVLFSTDRGITWRLGGLVEDPHTWLIEPALHETQQGGLVMFCRSGAGKTYSCVSSDRGKSWTKPAPLPGGKTNDLVKNPNSKVSLVTIDNQILMVHHPSSVDRSPLVLSLSVDDGKTWEQLAVLEGSAEMGGSSGGGGIMPSQASMLNNTKTANNNTKSNTSSTTTTNVNPSSSTMQYNGDPKAVIGGSALNYSYPCITQWTEDTVKVVYTVWGEGLRMVTATLATVDT